MLVQFVIAAEQADCLCCKLKPNDLMITFSSLLSFLTRIKVWDLGQETVVTTYNGEETSQNCS